MITINFNLFIIIIILLFMVIKDDNKFHPLNHVLLLIIYTVNIMCFNYFYYNKSLYSMMIMITVIGSMMTMFMYFISLINNESQNLNPSTFYKKYLFIFMLILLMIYLFLLFNEFIMMNYNKLMNNENLMLKIYISPYNYPTLFCMYYLFFCLIMSIKMCSTKYMPLRKIYDKPKKYF